MNRYQVDVTSVNTNALTAYAHGLRGAPEHEVSSHVFPAGVSREAAVAEAEREHLARRTGHHVCWTCSVRLEG